MRNGKITCLANASPSIHVKNVSSVRLDSISFYQCGSLLLRSIPRSVITGSLWSKSRNSAIVIQNSSTVIINCQITDAVCCYSGCGVHAKQSNMTFMGDLDIQKNIITNSSICTGSGGGLYLEDSYVYLNGSVTVAKNMAARVGGGMCVLSGSLSSTIKSSLVISENIVHSRQSAGGGLYLRGVNVKLTGLTILTGNNASQTGGGIHMLYSTCIITGYILLHSNTAQWDGGGLYMESGSIIMTSVNFSQNTAKDGGGALQLTGANLTVNGWATFINNTSGWSGGAIAAYMNCAIFFIGNVLFVDNIATHYGGAIYTVSYVLSFFVGQSIRFTQNSASEGGALYLSLYSKCSFGGEAIYLPIIRHGTLVALLM